MAKSRAEIRIPMQVGTEFRIRNNGDIILDNPELELAADPAATDAVLSYRFDSESGEHLWSRWQSGPFGLSGRPPASRCLPSASVSHKSAHK
jgi:hypothetical protein